MKGLHWLPDGTRLVDSEGIMIAHLYAYGSMYEWKVLKVVDPMDGTYGTSASPTAARKAIEAAIQKFGLTVRNDGEETKKRAVKSGRVSS